MSAISPTSSKSQDDLLRLWSATREVEAFLLREAKLADAHEYQAWLALWAPQDVLYWAPVNEDDDPNRKVSLIHDDRNGLEERVFRLGTPLAFSQRPRSKLLRTISNVELQDYDAAKGGWVESRFVIGEFRSERDSYWMGRQRHQLVRTADGLRIQQKHVFLLKSNGSLYNLTFLL